MVFKSCGQEKGESEMLIPMRLKVVLQGEGDGIFIFRTLKDGTDGKETWGPLHGSLRSTEKGHVKRAAVDLARKVGVGDLRVESVLFEENRQSASDGDERHYVWVHASTRQGHPAAASSVAKDVALVRSYDELETMLVDASEGTRRAMMRAVTAAKLLRQEAKIAARA